MKNSYYAYYILDSKKSGIVDNWQDCKREVEAKNARYKKFKSKEQARKWLEGGAKYTRAPKSSKKKLTPQKLEDGIYFDAGTGRGIGVEVRLTDKDGNSLLSQILKDDKITSHGNYHLGKSYTNNYGELMGLYLALILAQKKNIKKIFGDSSLVIDYWSKNMIKKQVAQKTRELATKVSKLRDEYEKYGGKITHIGGDINPADLGFHR